MGGSPLTIPCTLVKNGIGVDIDILADTGANGFAFMNTALANQLCKSLDLRLMPLIHMIQAKGYDGQSGQVASHYLTLNLIIEGRRQYNLPFIILNLGAHEVILGRKWFEYFWVNPDVASHRLIWRLENTPMPSFMRILWIACEDLAPQMTDEATHKDIVRRDVTMARNEKRRQDGRRILKRQDQPEAEISPVSMEQDDTTAPPTGEIATVASRTKEDEKPAWSPKLLSKRTWLTDTCNAL